jgi:hypothetical protein
MTHVLQHLSVILHDAGTVLTLISVFELASSFR